MKGEAIKLRSEDLQPLPDGTYWAFIPTADIVRQVQDRRPCKVCADKNCEFCIFNAALENKYTPGRGE